jgi:hypothetical protein
MVLISLVPALTPLYRYVNIIIIIIITYLLTYLLLTQSLTLPTSLITYPPTYLLAAIEFSPGGSSCYTSTDKQIRIKCT